MAALARTQRAGSRRRFGLSGSLVEQGERALAGDRAGPRPLVADRLEGSHLPDHRARRRTRVGARLQPRRRQAAVGDGRPRPHARVAAPEEQPRVGHGDHRRHARLRVVRQQGPHGGRLRRPHALAPLARHVRQLSRHRRLAAALQGPADRVPGSRAAAAFVTALDTATGKTALAHQPARHGRLEHADRDPRVRPRRDHRQQPVAACTPTTPTPARSCGPAAATCSK